MGVFGEGLALPENPHSILKLQKQYLKNASNIMRGATVYDKASQLAVWPKVVLIRQALRGVL